MRSRGTISTSRKSHGSKKLCCSLGKILLLLLIFAPLSVSEVEAACLPIATDSRLNTDCLVSRLEHGDFTPKLAQLVDHNLKQEGYDRGLGLPGKIKTTSFKPYFSPLITYSSNINGGNPNRPLILGDMEFLGDEELLRKEGLVEGIVLGVSGRHIYGKGRYFDYGAGYSYAHSPKHNIGISRTFAQIHSKNHIRNHWYLDGYANTNNIALDLKSDRTSSVGINLVKLFKSDTAGHNQATVGVSRLWKDGYKQNQLNLGLKTLYQNELYTDLNFTVGDPVYNANANRYLISAKLGAKILGKPLSFTYTCSYAGGSTLLGFSRIDKTNSLTINYSLSSYIDINVGYKKTNSSIDYFSNSEPEFGLSLKPILF